MKPSIVVSPWTPGKSSFLNLYPFLQQINVASDCAVNFDFQNLRQYRFTSTVDVLFSAPFLELVKTGCLCLRTVSTFSEQSELSVSLNFDGMLLLTMSQRLYESTGLDAAQVIVDSVQFSSTARLLSFDLNKLACEAGRLKRIREQSELLAKQVFSCEFVAISRSPLSSVFACCEEPLPKMKSKTVDCFGLFEEDESDAILQEKVEWMSLAVTKPRSGAINISGMTLYSLEGPLLPSLLISQLLENLMTQSKYFVLSAKAPSSIPPQPHLNKLRTAHFSASKFDPTTATTDQQGFFVLKTPPETSLFTLNTTA